MKLITKENEGNYIREYEGKNSKCSSLFNNNFLKIYEKDSLENVEKKLQNKIIDMEKEECVEYEIGSLDISVNKINKKKTKKKIMKKIKIILKKMNKVIIWLTRHILLTPKI